MKVNRRQLLAGVAALTAEPLLGRDAEAWFPRGQQLIGHGWNTLPLGAGGQIWGLHIANDGKMVCHSDVGGAYIWSGTSAMASLTDPSQKWIQVCNYTSFGVTAGFSQGAQPWEFVQAPGNSNYLYLVTGDSANASKYALYYSSDRGTSWTLSNLDLIPTPGTVFQHYAEHYKVAADPNNEKIVYVGMPTGSATQVTGIVSDGTGAVSGNILTCFSGSITVGSLFNLFSGPGGTNFGAVVSLTLTASASLASIVGTTLYVGGTIGNVWHTGAVLNGTGVAAQTFINGALSNATASATGSTITLTTFTPGVTTGTWIVGMTLSGTGVTAGTFITVDNGDGTFQVNNSQAVTSTTISGSIAAFTVNNSQSVSPKSMTGTGRYTLGGSGLASVASTLSATMAWMNGFTGGIGTTFDRTLGHTWPTFNAATLNGTTGFPNPTVGTAAACSGIAFDTSLGTITINGQTVTKRVILCVGGAGIYETTDGGQNWTEIAVTAFGTSTFHVTQGFFDGDTNANGVHNYYCTVSEQNRVYRYIGGGTAGWTPIRTTESGSWNLIVDPRPGAYPTGGVGYLTYYGANGIAVGFTSTNANIGTPAWGGSSGGQTPVLQAASYDIPYLNNIFGQGAFTNGVLGIIDANGTCFWCGNQSIWYFDSIPNYSVSTHTISNSFGRGQEATVGVDMLCPPGASYPILACQDLGAPMVGNTFAKYPTDMSLHQNEATCQNLEYAANDPSVIIARRTGETGSIAAWLDYSCYSTDYGATWTQIAAFPTDVWNATFNGSISSGILTVTSFITGSFIPSGAANGSGAGIYSSLSRNTTASATGSTIALTKFSPGVTTGTWIVGHHLTGTGVSANTYITADNGDGTFTVNNSQTVASTTISGAVTEFDVNGLRSFGSGGTTGTGGTGTYSIGGSASISGIVLSSAPQIQGGQIVAVDKDHWVCIGGGAGGVGYVPAYTTTATTTATWALCQKGAASGGGNMPVQNYMIRGGWSFGATSKPMAVGYGTDLGTVWLAQYVATTGVITLWRSADSGATFDSVGTVTGQINGTGIYLLSVPNFPDQLWLGILITSGGPCFWHVTGARTTNPVTITAATTPPIIGSNPARSLLHTLALGAPSSPGGYPLLYATFQQNGVGQAPAWLYQGTWNDVTSTLTWALYGPAGADQGSAVQLPQSMQFNAVGALRGDWNVPGRIYACNNGLGYAYYNP